MKATPTHQCKTMGGTPVARKVVPFIPGTSENGGPWDTVHFLVPTLNIWISPLYHWNMDPMTLRVLRKQQFD